MRRFIAYLLMALAMIAGIVIAFNPVFSKVNAGREFTNSYEVVYTLKSKDDKELTNKNVEAVASEMRSRLDDFAVEDYSVKTQGEDTISVSFAADESEFNYIVKYLKYSGDRSTYTLIGQNNEQYAGDKIFDDSVAYIRKVQDTIPYVNIPVSEEAAGKIEQFLKTIDGDEESGEDKASRAILKEGDDEEQKGDPINVYLVYDWDDADSYEESTKDPHIAEKVLMEFSSKHIWYEDSDEEHTEIQYLCGTGDENGNYDLNNLKFANLKARYLVNMFNATSYDVDVDALYVSESASGITYNYNQVKATQETLLVYGSDVNVKMSVTLISVLIATAIISLLVVVFYRVASIAVISTTLGSIFLTLVAFVGMGGLFNIPAFIGAISLSVCSLFGQIYYLNRFKEEVYKGRSIRKANQEASKKATLIHIDASVIFAFAGLMAYVIGGEAIKPLGTMLFFGAIIILLMNLVIFRFMMYLVTNTTAFNNKYSLFAIEEKDVPSVLEDKQSVYVAPYESVNFTKHKKVSGIALGVLSLAAIVGISIFGGIKGSPLNVENVTKDYSALYVLVTNEDRVIVDEDSFNDYVLKYVQIDGENISVDVKNDISYQKSTRFSSETLKVEVEPDNIFRVDLSGVSSIKEVKYSLDEGKTYEGGSDVSIEDAIKEIVMKVENINNEDKVEVGLKTTHETVTNPSQARIALFTAALVLGAGIYFMFRFRISRGLATIVVASSSSLIAYGALALSRISVSPIAAIAMPVVALSTILLGAFYLVKEKELLKEEKGELSHENRMNIMKKAIALGATSTVIFAIVITYVAINFFGFGLSSLSFLFADILLGDIIGIIAVFSVLGPLAMWIEKLLSKIKLPKFTRKEKKRKVHEAPKTSEPEERIYIGIND